MEQHEFQRDVMVALRDLQVTQADTTNELRNLVQ